ncbi:Ig-like domain-containing protein, partial [Marinomonas arenicola]|uniref:Ig-like domain-containing protein n=1 Tax=Marinomonas arenicola TaxID=569601 RepID=UPI00311DA854
GTWTFEANSAFDELNVGDSKVESFTVTSVDGTEETVTITINGTDDGSILSTDSSETSEDQAVSGNVLTNDSDIDNTLAVSSFKIEGDNTTHTITINDDGTVDAVDVRVDGVTVGSLVMNTDGSYSFTPTEDWSGSVPTITYTTNTGASSTLDIIVDAVADAPSLSVIETVTITTNDVDTGSSSVSGNGYTLTGYSNFVGINSDDNEIGKLTTVIGTSHDGIGVDAETANGSDPFSEIGSDADQNEAIVIAFDDAVTSVQASFGWLSSSETATYTLYSDGKVVATGTFSSGTDTVDDAGTISFTDEDGNLVAFDAIVFSAEYDPSAIDSTDNDFLLNSLSFENVMTPGTEALSTLEGGDVSFSISAATTDVDGSETLKVEVKDIPVGFTLTDGTNTFTAEVGSMVADVTDWNLSELTLETDYIEETTTYDLEVVATASEDDATSASTQTISIKVVNDESIATPSIVFESTGDDDVYNAEELGEDGTVTATISVAGSEVGDTLTYVVGDGEAVTVTLTENDITNGVAVEVSPDQTIKATLSDEAGNSSSEVSATAAMADLFVDPPVITNITDDSANSDYSTVTLHGTGEPGTSITLHVISGSSGNGNDTQTGEYVEVEGLSIIVDENGNWTADVSNLTDVQANDNEFFKATQTDAAGNVSADSNTAHYWHGSATSVSTEVGDDYVLSGSGNDQITITGNDDNDGLTIDGGAGVDTVIFSDSDFDLDKTSFVLNDDGSLQITRGDTNDIVLLIDVENVKINGTTYTLDALFTPVVTIEDDLNNDGLLNSGESDGTVSVTVILPLAAKVGDQITIASNNGEDDRVITLNPNHLANTSVSVSGIAVTEGEILEVSASLSTGGGVGSDSALVDTSVSGLTADITDATNSGSNDDTITNNATPTIAGQTEPGATVTITYTDASGTEQTTDAVTADTDGNYSITIPAALDEGSNDLTVKAVDVAGNETTITQNVTVDTSVSGLTANITDATNSGSNEDTITNNAKPTIAGQTEAGATVTITYTDASGTEQTTDAVTADTDGNYSITIPAALDEGSN